MKYILEYNQYLLESDDETGIEDEIINDSKPDDKKVQSFLEKHWKKIAIVLGTAAVGVTAAILYKNFKNSIKLPDIDDDTFDKIQNDALREVMAEIEKHNSNVGVGDQIELINILKDNSPEKSIKTIAEIATSISNNYILKFDEVNADLGKTIEFLNKNKDRNFEENPLTVKYSDFKLNDKSPSKNNIYVIKNAANYLSFKRKITSRIKGNIALSEFFKTYPDLIKHRTKIPALHITLTSSLKEKGKKGGVTITHLNHFMSNLKL